MRRDVPVLTVAAMTTPFIDDDIAVETTDPEPPGQSDRVLLGVAGLIADALGVDALWVRIGFVLLGLAGGVGVVLYLGVWLALIGPRTTDAMWVRYLGGVIVVAGVPLMIATVDVNITTGPLVVLVLLIALAVALWQPRVERSERPGCAEQRGCRCLRPSALRRHRRSRPPTTTSFRATLARWPPIPIPPTQRRCQMRALPQVDGGLG